MSEESLPGHERVQNGHGMGLPGAGGQGLWEDGDVSGPWDGGGSGLNTCVQQRVVKKDPGLMGRGPG